MNNAYKKSLYKMYFKRTIWDVPKLILISLAVAFAAFIVFVFTTKLFSEDVNKITVAYVIDEEDASFKTALKYLSKSANCKLKSYSKDEAIEALYNQDVAAVLIIDNYSDDGHKRDVNDSSMEFIYPDSGEFITSVFGDVIRSGLSDYIVVRSSAKTVSEVYPGYDEDSIEALKDNLMDTLIDRNKNYKRIIYTSTGDVPLSKFYAGTAITLIVLLSAAILIGVMKKDDKAFLINLTRLNITKFDIFMARYVPVIILYVILTLIISIIYQIFYIGELNLPQLFGSLLSTTVLLGSIIVIHEIISDNSLSIIGCLAFTIISLLIGGSIIPLAYLPEMINSISSLFVTKWTTRAYGQLLFGITNTNTLISLLIGNALLIIVIAILITLRKETTLDEAN